MAASLLLVFLALSGCQGKDSLDSLLNNYQGRVSSVLDLKADLLRPSDQDALSRYPTQRQLEQPLTPLQIDLLEFLQLSRCDLQRLIGERNSSLGKVMAHSQQLLYHRRFILLTHECLRLLTDLNDSEALVRALELALAEKQKDLAAAQWNASFASREFQQLFSTATPALSPLEATRGQAQLLQAITALRKALTLSTPPEGGEFEAHYAIIGSDKQAGRLLQAQAQLSQTLNRLTLAVDERLARRHLCLTGTPTPEARNLQRVFLKFYIGEVQPYIAQVHRHSKELRQELISLRALFPGAREAFDHYWQGTWAEQPLSTWSRFNAAIAAHTQMWQSLLSDCGLSPGNPAPS
jgi:hypothetical protein